MCFSKGCGSYRKSIRRDKLEGEFERLLTELRPSESMFELARMMFEDAWSQRATQGREMAKALTQEVVKIERQIEALLDRVVDASSSSVISAYEKRIANLEKQKLVAAEKAGKSVRPVRPFEEMFELAMNYLSNPYNLWLSDRLEDKKTVLKLTFSERLAYSRNEGFRTPKTTIPFKVLADFQAVKNGMARPKGFEPLTPRFVVLPVPLKTNDVSANWR